MSPSAKPMQSPLIRLALDLGPLLIFFVAYQYLGIYGATAAFIPSVIIALAVDYLRERRLSPMPTFTAVVVVVFGGLTIVLKNDAFIKLKPTILYTLFGSILLVGLAFNQLFLKRIFGGVFDLTESGWRKLTWRWGTLFFCLAVLNVLVWLKFSEAFWVFFHVWVIMAIIFLFALAQTPFVLKHENPPRPDTDSKT